VVETVDFAKLSVDEQIAQVKGSDILLGMHGAGLTHVLWLPEHGALFELWPKPNMGWRCFRHLSEVRGLLYDSWTNHVYPKAFRSDSRGEYTVVNVDEVKTQLSGLVRKVLVSKKKAPVIAL